QLYANTDDVDPREFEIDYNERPEIDRWILSKYNNLVKSCNENMDIWELTRVVRDIQNFVIEDLSNWYIRRCRRRFWSTELDDDKKSVYNSNYEVLVVVSKLIAPFVPYKSEELYRHLTDGESVHLELYPETNKDIIDNTLEQRMDLVRDLVGLGSASRET